MGHKGECKYCKEVLYVSGNSRNAIKTQSIFFPPSGPTFLSSICKNLKEEFAFLREYLYLRESYPLEEDTLVEELLRLSYSKGIRTWYHLPDKP